MSAQIVAVTRACGVCSEQGTTDEPLQRYVSSPDRELLEGRDPLRWENLKVTRARCGEQLRR